MRPRDTALLVDLFTGAVVVSVAVALAGLTWRLFDLATHRAPEPSPMGFPVPARAPTDLTPILSLAPFGVEQGGDPRPTTLPVELRGVLRAMPAAASTALIAGAGGTPLSYRVGQAIPAGATIEAIRIDSVVLRVGGHRELLTFPRSGAPPAAAAVAPDQAASPATTPSTPGVSSPSPPASPRALLDSFGATPVNGGYRIAAPLAPTARRAGLLPGDVIDQVNGTPLGDQSVDRRTLAMAARSGDLRVALIRNGRRTMISVPLR